MPAHTLANKLLMHLKLNLGMCVCLCVCVACGVWRVACGVWRVACGVWRVTCGVWRVACGVWRVACGVWRVACDVCVCACVRVCVCACVRVCVCVCVKLLCLSIIYFFIDQYKRVCYYTNWAQYRHGKGKFIPEKIDASLCSHIIYAYAKLESNSLAPYEWNDRSTRWMQGM